MTTPMEWLSEPWAGDLPFDDFSPPIPGLVGQPTRLHVLAKLMGCNGGSVSVRGWGCTHGGGLYGQSGLVQEEALSLMVHGSYLSGMVDALGPPHADEVQRALDAEWARVKACATPAECG